MEPVQVLYNFSSVVTGGAAKTIDVPLPSITDLPGEIVGIEAYLNVTAKTGAGVTPTLDVSIQSSPDNFTTAALTQDVIVFNQKTDAGTEAKSISSEDAVVKLLGANRRIHTVADSASGDVTFAFSVRVIFRLC